MFAPNSTLHYLTLKAKRWQFQLHAKNLPSFFKHAFFITWRTVNIVLFHHQKLFSIAAATDKKIKVSFIDTAGLRISCALLTYENYFYESQHSWKKVTMFAEWSFHRYQFEDRTVWNHFTKVRFYMHCKDLTGFVWCGNLYTN